MTKTCARCALNLDTTTFKPDTKSRDGLKSWCIPCFKQYDRERGLTRYKTRTPGKPRKAIVEGMLKCGTCGVDKPTADYCSDSSVVSGFRSRCKDCDTIAAKAYYEVNSAKRIASAARWNKANRARHVLANNRYVNSSVSIKLSVRLRSRLANAVRMQINYQQGKFTKGASAVRDLGCTVRELMFFLEAKFQPGMTWDNYGEWEIDHIYPLSRVDLTDAMQCKKAVHYTNLQPLWAIDNNSKGNKLPTSDHAENGAV